MQADAQTIYTPIAPPAHIESELGEMLAIKLRADGTLRSMTLREAITLHIKNWKLDPTVDLTHEAAHLILAFARLRIWGVIEANDYQGSMDLEILVTPINEMVLGITGKKNPRAAFNRHTNEARSAWEKKTRQREEWPGQRFLLDKDAYADEVRALGVKLGVQQASPDEISFIGLYATRAIAAIGIKVAENAGTDPLSAVTMRVLFDAINQVPSAKADVVAVPRGAVPLKDVIVIRIGQP